MFFQKKQLWKTRRHAIDTQCIAGVTYAAKQDTRVSLLPTLADDSCSFQYFARSDLLFMKVHQESRALYLSLSIWLLNRHDPPLSHIMHFRKQIVSFVGLKSCTGIIKGYEKQEIIHQLGYYFLRFEYYFKVAHFSGRFTSHKHSCMGYGVSWLDWMQWYYWVN